MFKTAIWPNLKMAITPQPTDQMSSIYSTFYSFNILLTFKGFHFRPYSAKAWNEIYVKPTIKQHYLHPMIVYNVYNSTNHTQTLVTLEQSVMISYNNNSFVS